MYHESWKAFFNSQLFASMIGALVGAALTFLGALGNQLLNDSKDKKRSKRSASEDLLATVKKLHRAYVDKMQMGIDHKHQLLIAKYLNSHPRDVDLSTSTSSSESHMAEAKHYLRKMEEYNDVAAEMNIEVGRLRFRLTTLVSREEAKKATSIINETSKFISAKVGAPLALTSADHADQLKIKLDQEVDAYKSLYEKEFKKLEDYLLEVVSS